MLIPLPFSNLSAIKQRPALIISNDRYNFFAQDLLICGITSQINKEEYSTIITNYDLEDGALPATSRIKSDKLFSIHKNCVRRKFGRVRPIILDKVKKSLLQLITN